MVLMAVMTVINMCWLIQGIHTRNIFLECIGVVGVVAGLISLKGL